MSDLELMRERYLDLALENLNGRNHDTLIARVLAAAEKPAADDPAADDADLPPMAVLPPVSLWRPARVLLQAACLVLALGLVGWLIVQRATPPQTPVDAPLPSGVRALADAAHHSREQSFFLDRGAFLLQSGAPAVSGAGHTLSGCTGLTVIRVGPMPDAAYVSFLNALLSIETPALTIKEQAMLINLKRWSAQGALALCVLSGSIVIDGKTIDAQVQDDDVAQLAAEYFAASDSNKDGKLTWTEVLDRDREYKAASKLRRNDDQAKAFLAKYEFVIEREMFLHADTDDNFEVTLPEYTAFLLSVQGENADEPAFTDKDLAALGPANVEDFWAVLLPDADTDGNKKLSHNEIRDYFLLSEVESGSRINPDGTREEWENGVDEDIRQAFEAADKNKDKGLDKAEYAEFVVLEHKAGDERFLTYEDQTPDQGETTAAAAKPIKLTPGSTLFVKEMTHLHKDRRTGQWTRELQHRLVTIQKSSPLGYKANTRLVDANKRPLGDDSGSNDHTWGKGFDHSDYKLETLKIGGVEYQCGYNEYEVPRQITINDEKVGGEGNKKVQVWHLRGLPGLEVKRIDDGVVVYELLELKIK